MKEVLELETRRAVYNLILKNLGLHLREISRRLGMNTSLAEYHLRNLEKSELVIAIEEGGYKRYYVKGKTEISVKDKRILGLLNQKIPLKIVLFLLKNPNSKHNEIANELRILPSTLSPHLKKLTEKGILKSVKYGEKKGYAVINEEDITELPIRYKPGPKDLVDGFIEAWSDFYQ
jgi:predicted transcriptional regulator